MIPGTAAQTRMRKSNFRVPDTALDYHAHVLPGCDHGSDGTETSLRQLEMAQNAGISVVCATPHFYPQRENVASFLERRMRAAELLRECCPEGTPSIRLGAEVLICDGMERMRELPQLCLEGSNEVLLELPFRPWNRTIWDTLQRLHERDDIRIVIAHADRYPSEDIRQLIEEGIPLQLNVGCLRMPFRRQPYLSWIADGYVPYLGSDIHMLGRGYRDFTVARRLLNRHASPRGGQRTPEGKDGNSETGGN